MCTDRVGVSRMRCAIQTIPHASYEAISLDVSSAHFGHSFAFCFRPKSSSYQRTDAFWLFSLFTDNIYMQIENTRLDSELFNCFQRITLLLWNIHSKMSWPSLSHDHSSSTIVSCRNGLTLSVFSDFQTETDEFFKYVSFILIKHCVI